MCKNSSKIAILVLLAITTYACKTIIPATNALYVAEREGTITLRSEGVGDAREKSRIAAEQNAFNTPFFRDVADSSRKTPSTDYGETGGEQRNNRYFDEFFGNQRRCRTFAAQLQIAGEISKRQAGVETTINLRALCSKPERNGAARNFGH